jgi:hypothetical protein
MAYRVEGEPVDERPLLVMRTEFYADATEQMTYEAAVEDNPIRDGENVLKFMQRISAVVTGKYKGIVPTPRRPGLSRAEKDRQLRKLRGQGLPSRVEII